jgi:hypothetical protein
MAANPSDSLFELIKSLSKSEKRYFKIFSSKHTIGEENNYIILFDSIIAQDVYDEQALFREFEGAAFLNKFSITKKRLYDNILRSLDSFHANSSIDAQLYSMMHYAEILYDKSLYDQCRKLLHSAEKLATKHDKQTILLDIQLKTKRLLENSSYAGASGELLTEIKTKSLKTLQSITDYTVLWDIKSRILVRLNQNGIARTQECIKAFDVILEEMNECVFENTFENNYLIYHIHAAYYFAIANLEKSLEYILKNIELYKNNSDRLKEDVNIYFSLITNAIYINNQLGNYKNVDYYLAELKELAQMVDGKVSDDYTIKLFSTINSTELMLLNAKGKFEQSLKLIPIVEEGYRLYGSKINRMRRAYLNFNFAVAKFGLGDFSGALKWINTILNDKEFDEKQDIYCFSQLLNLVVHFELNNRQLLPYAIKNTQRYLKSRNRVYKFEEVFLKYLNKIARTENPMEQIDVLEDLLKEIQPLLNNPFEKNVFESFDFITWIQSKVKNKKFADLIIEGHQERSK